MGAKAGKFNERRKVMLLNTADGWVLFLKQLTYWCEVLAGLTLLVSHFVIWWFAPERPHNFLDELLDMRKHIDFIKQHQPDLGRLRRLDLTNSRRFLTPRPVFLERTLRNAMCVSPFPSRAGDASTPLLA